MFSTPENAKSRKTTHCYLVCCFSHDVLYSSSVCVCLLLYILLFLSPPGWQELFAFQDSPSARPLTLSLTYWMVLPFTLKLEVPNFTWMVSSGIDFSHFVIWALINTLLSGGNTCWQNDHFVHVLHDRKGVRGSGGTIACLSEGSMELLVRTPSMWKTP